MKPQFLIPLIALTLGGVGQAAVIVDWSVAGNNGTNPFPLAASTADTNINVPSLSITGLSYNSSQSSTNNLIVLTGLATSNATSSTDDYLAFTVTPDSGYQVTYTDFQFVARGREGTEIFTFELFSRIGSGSFTSLGKLSESQTLGYSPELLNFNFSDFTTSDSVEFRLSAAVASTSTNRGMGLLNDGSTNVMTLNGSVTAIPEPTTVLMFIGGLCGVFLLRRRRLA